MTEKNLIILVAYRMTINHQNDETGKKRGGGGKINMILEYIKRGTREISRDTEEYPLWNSMGRNLLEYCRQI